MWLYNANKIDKTRVLGVISGWYHFFAWTDRPRSEFDMLKRVRIRVYPRTNVFKIWHFVFVHWFSKVRFHDFSCFSTFFEVTCLHYFTYHFIEDSDTGDTCLWHFDNTAGMYVVGDVFSKSRPLSLMSLRGNTLTILQTPTVRYSSVVLVFFTNICRLC